MKPALETGITQLSAASFKTFRLHQPAFRSHWHYHPELELVLFTRGKGMRFIGDDISLYAEGDLFLIGENLPHTFVSYEDERTPLVEAFCIQFPVMLFAAFPECKPLESLFEAAKRGIWFPKPDSELIECIKQLVASGGITALAQLLDLLNRLQTMPHRLPVLVQAYQRHTLPTETPTRVRLAIDYINAHYQQAISVQQMASECHFSPSAFCRWFKQQMGLTFVDYVNKVRLTHVCQLLLSTDLPVGQIAAQTGFDNSSTLNRLFQAKLNTAPSRYRTQSVLATRTVD